MQELTDSSSLVDDGDALRARLASDGYLFFRGLLDPARVATVRSDFFSVLDQSGWIAPGATVDEPVPTSVAVREGGEGYFKPYVEIQSLQSFHELAHDEAILGVVDRIFGEPLLVHPRSIARTSLPHDDEYTPPHQEYRLIQGSVDSMTVWVPIGDCPVSLGALRMLSGSHRAGLAPAAASSAAGGMRIDVDDDDPAWRISDYASGDAILFTSITVHGAVRNNEDVLRFSADFRYQPLHDPVVEASLLPHYHPQVPDWDELTIGWDSVAAVTPPDGVKTVEMLPPLDPNLTAPPSRILASA